MYKKHSCLLYLRSQDGFICAEIILHWKFELVHEIWIGSQYVQNNHDFCVNSF